MAKIKAPVFLWLVQVFLITFICGVVYLAVQQNFRQNANDPQIQISEDIANQLAFGGKAENYLGTGRIVLSQSLASFVSVYDLNGNLVASNAILNGQVPQIPRGVFSYARQFHQDRFTWQPDSNVRLATVATYYNGEKPGFVIVGRSLREVERRIDQLTMSAMIAWFLGFLGATILSVFYVLIPSKRSLKD